jgi:hypothetical protein
MPLLSVRDNAPEGVVVQVVPFQPQFKFEPLMYVFATPVAIILWEEGRFEGFGSKWKVFGRQRAMKGQRAFFLHCCVC